MASEISTVLTTLRFSNSGFSAEISRKSIAVSTTAGTLIVTKIGKTNKENEEISGKQQCPTNTPNGGIFFNHIGEIVFSISLDPHLIPTHIANQLIAHHFLWLPVLSLYFHLHATVKKLQTITNLVSNEGHAAPIVLFPNSTPQRKQRNVTIYTCNKSW